MSNLLDRATIFSQTDYKIEKVEIPEWNGHVFVRSMTGLERDRYEASVVQRSKNSSEVEVILEGARGRLVALTTCDENGNLIFEESDLKELNERNANVLDRLFTISSRLSGLTQDDMDELTTNFSETKPELSFSP